MYEGYFGIDVKKLIKTIKFKNSDRVISGNKSEIWK